MKIIISIVAVVFLLTLFTASAQEEPASLSAGPGHIGELMGGAREGYCGLMGALFAIGLFVNPWMSVTALVGAYGAGCI